MTVVQQMPPDRTGTRPPDPDPSGDDDVTVSVPPEAQDALSVQLSDDAGSQRVPHSEQAQALIAQMGHPLRYLLTSPARGGTTGPALMMAPAAGLADATTQTQGDMAGARWGDKSAPQGAAEARDGSRATFVAESMLAAQHLSVLDGRMPTSGPATSGGTIAQRFGGQSDPGGSEAWHVLTEEPAAAASARTDGARPIWGREPALIRVERLGAELQAVVTEFLRNAGQKLIQIRIDPVELGRVRIMLQMSDAGLHVHIMAERVETLDLMRRFATDLAQDMAQMGFSDLMMSFSDRSDDAVPAEQGHRDLAAEPGPSGHVQIVGLELIGGGKGTGGMDLRV